MEGFNLYQLKENFNQEGILICFAGHFTHSIIEELGTAVKHHLEAAQLAKSSLLDVFSVFIEQAQNVRNYAEQQKTRGNQDHDFNSGIVTIGKSSGRHLVCSGNFVERSDIAPVIALLDRLKGLDKQELKGLYKEQLRRRQEPAKGAGLGLLDMARKCSEPLHYSIREIDDRYCFFSINALI